MSPRQGLVPTFGGLSAQRIPDNPDTNLETNRLLLQFSASSYRSASSRSNSERGSLVPRSGVQISSSPQPLTLPPPSSSHQLQPASSSRAQVPLQLVSPSPILSSPQLVSAPRSSRGDSRQRTLRESVAITNASKSVETMNPISHPDRRPGSTTSSRSISPVEQSSIRRSGRARAQPVNYYTRIHIGSEEPETHQEAPTVVSPKMSPQEPIGAPPRRNLRNFLWGRELGGTRVDPEMMSDLKPWKSWKGASGDILSLAWSPDGTRFAAGAAARTDEYNRGNNFILGDVPSSRLKEIPDHHIPRPNALPVDDPNLYMSVTDMQWVGNRLYTSSLDKTVKIWDAKYANNISCMQTLEHESQVDVTAVSTFDSSIVATGTTSIMVWDTRDLENPTSTTLHLDRDTRYRPNVKFQSTALAWGHTPFTKEFLAGGMSDQEPGDEPNYKGHLGLWRAREASFETIKVSTNSQNINDLTWHSLLPQFATASPEDPHNARIKGIGTATKSIVRVFNLDCDLNKRVTSIMEFSCPAYDTNQVTFCPTDGRYITASCTDGATYVWDNRKGDRILHELRHGDPINPIPHDRSREMADVGVRVALWGSAGQFYTGASDGVLKRWDISRSTEDALLQNMATFDDEIMNASFSQDQSHLLVGDSGGAVHVLSSGPCADPDITEFKFEYARDPSAPNEGNEPGMSGFGTGGDISQPQSTYPSFNSTPSRSEKKRRREANRRRKAELFEREQAEVNGVNGVNGEEAAVNEVNGVHEEPAEKVQAERREKRRRKKRRLLKMQPIISNTESIDLTLDSDSEDSRPRLDLQELMWALEEDYWWPDSGSIDPNFPKDM